jgi:hypothetical protein
MSGRHHRGCKRIAKNESIRAADACERAVAVNLLKFSAVG